MWFVVDVVKRGCKGINHGRLGVIPFRPWILTTSLRSDMPILNVAFEAEARSTWLAALHQLALVDGDFDPEEQRQLAEQLNDDCPLQDFDWKHWRAPDLDEISRLFSSDPNSGEQFLRSAVVVALADGHLSQSELDLLQNWAEALGLKSELISSLVPCSTRVTQPWKPLDPLKHWLDGLDPGDERIASFIVHLIPAQCPFERDIILFGRKLVHIPPMCKINPLYEQLVALRFRCLGHLAVDEQLRISCRDSAQV